MTQPRRKLPIGIQTLREIREEGHYYVDKSEFARQLIDHGKYYFLSRPRRFGKSLFLDTLKELFEGNESLFQGLAIHPHWDWTVRYPVLRFSFGGGVLATRQDLDSSLDEQLTSFEAQHGLTAEYDDLRNRFKRLIVRLHQTTGRRVVILIDEYDKPILDCIDDSARAIVMREALKDFYSVIKDCDAHVRFSFLTGVSKFSKVSLFSGLNNFKDITVDARYSSLCGYTDRDVDTVFAPELDGLDRAEIKRWYNGYNWLGESVYNPFDVLLLLDTRQFKPYWFETGTPTFLLKLLTQRGYFTPDLSRIVATESLLSNFDVDCIPTETLLFQSGYLTIASAWQMPGRMELTLKYPNYEVQASLNESLLQTLSGNPSIPGPYIGKLYRLLQANDFAAMQTLFTAFYASIPNDWYRNNPIAQYEGYYASVFYSYFAALGLDLSAEESSNAGRLDMALRFNGHIYLFEFKVVELAPEGRALEQIKARGYALRYRADGQPIHLIGVEFSRQTRSVVGFEVETLA